MTAMSAPAISTVVDSKVDTTAATFTSMIADLTTSLDFGRAWSRFASPSSLRRGAYAGTYGRQQPLCSSRLLQDCSEVAAGRRPLAADSPPDSVIVSVSTTAAANIYSR